MKEKIYLGRGSGTQPHIHLPKDSGGCMCGAKKMPISKKRFARLKEHEWEWLCKKCLSYYKNKIAKEPY